MSEETSAREPRSEEAPGLARRVAAWRHVAPDIVAILSILALTAFFFWRLWAPGPADRVAFPKGDFTDQYYPLRHFVATTLAEGRIPFWNPFIFGGQPGLADPQAAVLYPPALLNALFWGARFPLGALELEAAAHIALAAIGAFFFARRVLALGGLPSMVAAVTFGFSGYLTGFPLEQITILETASWLPWFLLALHLAGTDARSATLGRRLVAAAFASIFFGIALLAGHPQMALYLLYVGLAYALLKVGQQRPPRATLPGILLPLAAPFVLGVALATAQLLPTSYFITESSRQAVDYNFVNSGLGWEELTTIFLPQMIGSPTLYLALLPLLLAPLGLLSEGQRGEKRFWAGTALVSLLLALGGHSVLFDLLYLGLPGIGQVRSQERVLLLWSWSISLLAACGAASITTLEGQRRLRAYTHRLAALLPILLLPWLIFWWLWAMGIEPFAIDAEQFQPPFNRYSFFFTLFTLSWAMLAWYGRRLPMVRGRADLALCLLLTLLILDLFTATRPSHIGQPRHETLTRKTEVVEALQTWLSVEPARVAVYGKPVPDSNDGMRWDLPMLSGNEPLRLAISKTFFDRAPSWRRLQLFAARYLVSDQDFAASEPEVYEQLATSPPGHFLLRIRPPMPYAWLVGQVEVPADRESLYRQLQEDGFNPRKLALLERPLPVRLSPATDGTTGEVTVEHREAGRVRVRVANPSSGPLLLLFAEPAASGWQTALNGESVPWYTANGLNVALPVPPGEHTVTLHYIQPGWYTGLIISGSACVLILLCLTWGVWQMQMGRRGRVVASRRPARQMSDSDSVMERPHV